MKRKIEINLLYNFLHQFLTILTPLITTPYVSRVLGAESIGAYSYTYSIIIYIRYLLNFGLQLYGNRKIAQEQDNRKGQTIIFWQVIFAKVVISIPCWIIYLVVLGGLSKYRLILLVQMIILVAELLDISFLFQGNEDFKTTSIIGIVAHFLMIILLFCYVKDSGDFIKYVAIMAFTSSLMCSILQWRFAVKYIDFVFNVKINDIFLTLNQSKNYFLPEMGNILYQNCDKIMLGMLLETTLQSGYYEQATKVLMLSISLISGLTTVLYPRFSYISKSEDYNFSKRIGMIIQLTLLFTIAMSFGVSGVSPLFVHVFFGEQYVDVIVLLYYLAPIIIIKGLNDVLNYLILLPKGYTHKSLFTLLIGLMSKVMVGIMLIPSYGAAGAAIAYAISEALILFGRIVVCKRVIEWDKIANNIAKYIGSGICMFILIKIMSHYMFFNLFGLMLLILCGGLCYFILLLALREENIMGIMKLINNKVKGNNNG